MLNKKTSLIAVLLILIIGFSFKTILSNKKEPMKRRPMKSQQKSIPILTVKNDDVQLDFEISGHLSAFDEVEIYAEVSGILLNMMQRFKAGTHYRFGELMIHIDDAVYKNTVLAQKSSLMNQLTLLLPDLSIDFPKSAENWRNYLAEFDLEKPLNPLPEPVSDKERYYIASRNIFNQYYSIKAMEATLDKYQIRAPFDGVVTAAEINPGTLVRVGQKIGEFVNTDTYELEAAAGIHDVQHLQTGLKVTLTSNEINGEFEGVIQRINAVIDPTSQTVKVYITTRDKRLRAGMYCTAHVTSQPISNAFRIARNLRVGENHVFAVKDSALVLKPIEIVGSDDRQLIVRGLADGTHLIGEPIPGAVTGMKIN
ncbi:HlyD family efflux transporter periplasmic adaptor subunit [candidate division KSB1 bacterium]|nr:HlyD family efflux transporter periplasmic adaptor subunit [candidate division KSB1 bacterium]